MKIFSKLVIGSYALFAFSATTLAQPATLKVGIAAEPYPPFSIKQSNGQWSGFEVDLVKQVCQEMKRQCKITEVAWDGIIPALQNKKIDMIFNSFSITPERQKVIAFSRPYFVTTAQFIGPKGVKMDTSVNGLKGKIIGVQSSTTHANFIKKYYSKTSTIRYYNTQDELNADMAAGRVNVMLLDALGASGFLASKSASKLEIKAEAPKDPLFGSGVGAGMRKGDTALEAQVNNAITALIKSGEFNRLQKKYFKIDISPKS